METLIRPAESDDRDAVASFTTDTWADRGGGDYVPHVFEEWVAADGDGDQTFVADADGRAVGLVRVSLLSPYEAWLQGMRVDPGYRGHDVGLDLVTAGFDWARERGAGVARNMVFSWNVAGLGHSRAAGFEPATGFRWANPEPDPEASPGTASDADRSVTAEPADAWSFWTGSDARTHLRGLALDDEVTWAVSELTRGRLREAAADDRLFVVGDGGGTRGFTLRTRTVDRERDGGETETWAEYAVAAWEGTEAARALYDAVARDASAVGADRTRVLIPEGVRWVSDTAAARVGVSEEPDFVLARDLASRQ
ncbi:MAG: GNAT family N-acetyltransferase [Haloferacaceae archaeon]